MSIIWTRPSGADIETNEEKATIAFAEANNWKRKKAKGAKSDNSKKPSKQQPEAL